MNSGKILWTPIPNMNASWNTSKQIRFTVKNVRFLAELKENSMAIWKAKGIWKIWKYKTVTFKNMRLVKFNWCFSIIQKKLQNSKTKNVLLGVGSIQSTLYAVRKYLEVRMFHGGRANLIRRSSWQGLQENMIAFNFHDLKIAKKSGNKSSLESYSIWPRFGSNLRRKSAGLPARSGKNFLSRRYSH